METNMANTVQERKIVEIPPTIPVRALAEKMGVSPLDLMKALIANGIMASITQSIDYETAAIVAEDLGYTLVLEGQVPPPVVEAPEAAPEPVDEGPVTLWYLADEDEDDLVTRPPVVTVMGHVDHGKTSLLDALRDTRVAAGESGGITQHIGAYRLQRDGQSVTFIDTPGHEAFSAMRARGAQATDIAIIVVAADDGVMPQTREAVDHAQAAHVPMIVAVNKIDLPAAKADRVMEQLSDLGVVPEQWGGDTFFVSVSATTGEGLAELVEAILLVAEEHPPKGNPKRPARGTVLESQVDQRRGVLATLLVQSGHLKRGDVVVVATAYGKVKAMFDETGKAVLDAGPSTPVAVLGLSEVPAAGSRFEVVANEKAAQAIVGSRLEEARPIAGAEPGRVMTLEEFFARTAGAATKTLNLVVKVDVQGSLEPVVDSIQRLGTDEMGVRILHKGAGDVTESDVNLAAASDAVVLAFRVDVDGGARRAAAQHGVEVREYSIIYKLVEDLQAALKGMLDPVYEDQVVGEVEVRQVFPMGKHHKAAGCLVQRGVIRRNATARVLRDGVEVGRSTVNSLRRFSEDVREVREGFECGVGLQGFDAFEEGDIVEVLVRERVR
jgi:translation initiation factor IF-2